MKKSFFTGIFLVIITAIVFAFTIQRTGSVKGSVNPIDGATQVWILSAKDTLRGAIQNGAFQVNGIKPGSCVLVIDAISPYKQTVRTGIEVYEGTETNVGEVILDKQK